MSVYEAFAWIYGGALVIGCFVLERRRRRRVGTFEIPEALIDADREADILGPESDH